MSHGRRVGLGLIFALAAIAAAGPAGAHTRSMSYSTWQLEADGAQVELRLKLLELTRQPPGHPWSQELPAQLQLVAADTLCVSSEASRMRKAPAGWAVFRWRMQCEPGPRRIVSSLMRGVAASHTHFVRIDPVATDPSSTIRERVLVTDREETWLLETDSGEAPGVLPSAIRYVRLGAQHIATGWDHLAFVLALLLLAGTLREVAGLVTGFTIGHSLTLGLAVLGVVRPEGVAVEVLIGFSIALVAAENSWLLGGRDRWIPAAIGFSLLVAAALAFFGTGALGPIAWLGLALFSVCHFGLLGRATKPAGLRSTIAFAFGLIHGFGFAGILMELELPAEKLLPALFGFNVGVELGQLAVVIVAWPLLHALARVSGEATRRVAETASAAIFGLGVFWLVSRNF